VCYSNSVPIRRTFLTTSKYVVTLKSGSEFTQSHRNRHRSVRNFLFSYTAIKGLSRTISQINGDFSRKSQHFPTHLYFAYPLKELSWNWVLVLGVQKTIMMQLPGRDRSLTISSAGWIQYTNVTDGRTDGRTNSDSGRDSKDRATHSVEQ